MQKDIDELRREQEHDHRVEESLHSNPVKREIQLLFQNEFSEDRYRKFKLATAKNLVVGRLQGLNATGAPGAAVARMTRKISGVLTIEDLLMMLNEYLFS